MPLILAALLQATFRSNPRSRRQGVSPRGDTVDRKVNNVKNDGPGLLEPHSVQVEEPVLL